MSEATEHSRLFVEERICHGGSHNREPTETELAEHLALSEEIEQAKEELRKATAKFQSAQDKCKHIVSIDYAGWPYDIRRCATCGMSQGLI